MTDLPLNMPHIPAMTTPEERACYYRLARESATRGAVIELGAWLGASTAWIAAGMRDSGARAKAHVYDRFLSKAGHVDKVQSWYADHGGDGAMPIGDCLPQFKANLGPLIDWVEVHRGEIAQLRWSQGPIALLVTDAPKRVKEISAVLTALAPSLQSGALMAWQDFCHFPSYDIPACLYRLRESISFVEAVVPGTTLVFRVSELRPDDLTPEALSLKRWTIDEVCRAWEYWLAFVPEEKRALFRCGAAIFLCDIGHPDLAVSTLAAIHESHAEAITPKWRYLHEKRDNLVKRYQPLFDWLAAAGAL